MNLLVVGRLSNITNLKFDKYQDTDTIVPVSTLDEVTKILQTNEIDLVIIGAGLDIDIRISITKMLLEHRRTISIYLCAKNEIPEGLMAKYRKTYTHTIVLSILILIPLLLN